jgi:hypothetical protein
MARAADQVRAQRMSLRTARPSARRPGYRDGCTDATPNWQICHDRTAVLLRSPTWPPVPRQTAPLLYATTHGVRRAGVPIASNTRGAGAHPGGRILSPSAPHRQACGGPGQSCLERCRYCGALRPAPAVRGRTCCHQHGQQRGPGDQWHACSAPRARHRQHPPPWP